MAEIGEVNVKISADTRAFETSLRRVTRLMAREPTLWDLVRTDPSVVLFWLACVLIPIVAGLAR